MEEEIISIFSSILREVVHEIPGAVGAIFVDWEGESVDGFTSASQSGLRLLGAHWHIVYNLTKIIFEKRNLGFPLEMVLRFSSQQIVIRRVTDSYVVLLALKNSANLSRARYILAKAEIQLREEM